METDEKGTERDETIKRLIGEIEGFAGKQDQWEAVTSQLNKLDVLTQRGKEWDWKNLRQYSYRNGLYATSSPRPRKKPNSSTDPALVDHDGSSPAPPSSPGNSDSDPGREEERAPEETHQEEVIALRQDEQDPRENHLHDEGSTTEATVETEQVETEQLEKAPLESAGLTEEEVSSPQEIGSSSSVTTLDDSFVEKLRSMVEWWEAQQIQPSEDQQRGDFLDMLRHDSRPEFDRASTATRTLRLSTKMLTAADRLARKHKAATGGTFSGLVELLVWNVLGQDPVYVKRLDEPEGGER